MKKKTARIVVAVAIPACLFVAGSLMGHGLRDLFSEPDRRETLVEAVGEPFVEKSEAYADSLEDDLALALERVEDYDTSSLCRMIAEKQVKLVSVQAAGMMDMMLKDEEWGSLDRTIDATSQRYFTEGCPVGLGTWMLARKNRNSQTTTSLIKQAVSGLLNGG